MIANAYGPLGEVVSIAGSIMGAVSALALAWRGRASWEPVEQDVSSGPQKVGGLLAALLIVLMWVDSRNSTTTDQLRAFVVTYGVGTLLFLVAYSALVGTLTYLRVVAIAPDRSEQQRIIGGFWLTSEARRERRAHATTVQEVLAGAAYDPDKVWSRPARQLAKTALIIGYMGLTICGTTALAAAAMLGGKALS